ncbi:hypothetical protein [Flavobacterium sp.]|uniref:hypothetical protein n=1 Tax=Flavobacterium sp. TaxID=239 RepID=UPI0039E31A9A
MEMVYSQSEGNSEFSLNGVPQYCNAKFNTVDWKAWTEPQNSIFTSTDAYRIETHFAVTTTPGSYAINESSGNYVRFSKFNTATLTYDYYNVTGTIAHSYREFHGAASYSYIGTFNFTAVNPNNPSDVIQVTDGTFRSYQKF